MRRLQNWANEMKRFTPELSFVKVHGGGVEYTVEWDDKIGKGGGLFDGFRDFTVVHRGPPRIKVHTHGPWRSRLFQKRIRNATSIFQGFGIYSWSHLCFILFLKSQIS